MEATDLAEALREVIERQLAELPNYIGSPETFAGYEESNFFVELAGERFLVAVMKVSE